MYAVKFEADVCNGMIVIPEEYKNLESQHLQITAVVVNNTFSPKIAIIEYSDEYIKENWKEMISKALGNVDADADDWKIEYGAYLADKNR